MKKITVISTVFSLFLISSIQADIRLGLKAGVNMANASFKEDAIQTSNFTGFQAGPIIEFDIPVIGIKLDAAVMYSQQGLKLNFNDRDFKGKESTLNIPVNLKIKFGLIDNLRGFLTAGPYVSFDLSGDNLSAVRNNIREEFENKSFGAGINTGFGIELFKHLQIGANYKISMTGDYESLNMENVNLKGKNRIWSVTAAFLF
jgi:hypothetical protein